MGSDTSTTSAPATATAVAEKSDANALRSFPFYEEGKVPQYQKYHAKVSYLDELELSRPRPIDVWLGWRCGYLNRAAPMSLFEHGPSTGFSVYLVRVNHTVMLRRLLSGERRKSVGCN